MKKTNLFAFAMLLMMATFTGCQKSDAVVLGIVSTSEVENFYGRNVEVCFANSTKMYFHLLSDSTAEVVNYLHYYTESNASDAWAYRGDIVIPDRFIHDGKTYKVTCIGEGAFKASTQNHEVVSLVSSVEMPNTIDTIRNRAFTACVHLVSIDIPNSVKYIGDSAFADSGLTSVTIPNQACSWGSGVFSGTCINSVVIPESMEKIPFSMFSMCPSLASVTLHDHVTTICDGAFYDSGLTSFEIPASVNYLGVNPLGDCSSLTTLVCLPTTPPMKDPGSHYFEDYFMLSSAIKRIIVPAQSVDLYKENHFWRLYKDIIVGM